MHPFDKAIHLTRRDFFTSAASGLILPHSPTPVSILTVSGAADAKANSLQTDRQTDVSSRLPQRIAIRKGKQRPIVYGALLITFCNLSKSAVTVS